MKKLLALLLVLGMVSAVSALPVISGPATIELDTATTYTVSGTSAEATPDGGGESGYSGVIWVDYSNYKDQLSNPTITANGNMGGLAEIDIAPSYLPSGFAFAAAPAGGTWDETTDVDTGEWFTFDVIANSTGLWAYEVGDTFEIQLLTGTFGSTGEGLVVTVIPEPMTIALLGLGGLFLRRRK